MHTDGVWHKRIMRVVVSALAIAASMPEAQAATYLSKQDGDWMDAATWTNNASPGAGDTVSVSSNKTVWLANAAGPVTLNVGYKSTAGLDGTLVLSNNAVLTCSSDTYVGWNGVTGSKGNLLIYNGAVLSNMNTATAYVYIGGGAGTTPGTGSRITVDGGSLVVTNGYAARFPGNGGLLTVTNGGRVYAQKGFYFTSSSTTNNLIYIGGGTQPAYVDADSASGGGLIELRGYTNGVVVDKGGSLSNMGLNIGNGAGAGCYLIITNGGSVLLPQSGGTYGKSYIGLAAGGSNNTVSVIGAGSSLNLNAQILYLGKVAGTPGNRLLVSHGGVVSNLSTTAGTGGLQLGSVDSNNLVSVTAGGLIELQVLAVGAAGNVGNVFSNATGGILQFTTATPSITVANNNLTNGFPGDLTKGNGFVVTNATISYRGITSGALPNLTDSLAASGGISTNNITYQGNNIYRLDSAYATNTLAGGYTFTNGCPAGWFAGLELVNGSSAVRGQAVTIGSGGSLLVSNITNGAAMFEGALTNNSAKVILASVNSLVASNGIVWLNNSAATTTARTVTFDAYTTNQLAGTVTWHQAATATQIVSGVVNGSGPLQKTGPGVLVLAASNSYSGATIVSNGALMVQGSVNSAVTVAAGGALGGTGTVYGAVANVGTNLVTVGDVGAYVKVSGALNISGATLTVANPGTLASVAGPFTLLTFTPNQLTGTYAGNNLPAGWMIKYNNALGTITLVKGYPGTLIKLQ